MCLIVIVALSLFHLWPLVILILVLLAFLILPYIKSDTIKNITLCILVTLLVLSLGEFAARYFLPTKLVEMRTVDSDNSQEIFVKNPELVYIKKPNFRYDINFMGMRDTHTIEMLPKDNNSTRIAVLGDSIVFGDAHCEKVPDDGTCNIPLGKRFPDILQEKLGNNYDIWNFGVQGYNLRQTVEFYKLIKEKIDADSLILTLNPNDVFTLPVLKKRKDKYELYYTSPVSSTLRIIPHRLASVMMKSCISCRFFSEHLSYILVKLGAEAWTYSFLIDSQEFADAINELHSLVREDQKELIVIIVPHLYEYDEYHKSEQSIHDFVKRYTTENEIHFHDFYKDFREIGFPNLTVNSRDKTHFNELGHAIVAERLYQILKENQNIT